ncbi:beta strand repeat-containing protein, partial [Herbaspirillum sp. B65]|uniref:beta strand repeat-containing protein n=1 Tax=Herbaspirillum sp. B65 TaxID=137708 RepID=UPI0005C82ADF
WPGSAGFAGGDTYSGIQNVIGSAYDDTFIADNNHNVLDGGLGSNTVSYAFSTAAVTVNLVNGTGTGGFADGDTYLNIQNVVGSALDDLVIANSQANSIDGGSSTASSHNRVSYASSNAAVTVDLNYTNGTGTSGGYAAGDKLANIQDLTGSIYDDTFVASAAANNFDGGTSTSSSHNRVSYASSNAAVTVDLNYTNGTGTSGGYAAGDTLTNIQDLTGSSFDDVFVASAAANNFDGGASTASSHNRVSYASSNAGVTVDLNYTDGTGTSGGYAAGDTLTNIQDLTGSNYDDTFVASAVANHFDGGGGNNTVSYARANDGNGVTVDLFQRVGSNGFAAGDQYTNIQNVIGSNYDDLFIADNNANSFAGGAGSNTVSYVNSTAAVTVNLASGSGSGGFAQGDSYSSIQNVIGSSFDDTIIASSDANVIDGGASTSSSHNRVSYASSNAAVTVDLNYTDGTGTSGGYAAGDKLSNIQDLTGSSFDDTFVASAAANNFDGGSSTASSHNRVSYASSNAAVTVDLNYTNGTGTSGGYAAGDTLTNIQDLTGSSFDDTFVASAAANNFDGGTSTSGSHNRVSYASSTAGVVVDLNSTDGTGTSGGYAAGDTLVNIQDLTGSNYDDTFVASAAANNFDGGG